MAAIPLFPLGNALFPDGVLHLRIFEVRYLDMIGKCVADGTCFGVVPLLQGSEVRTPEGHETLACAGTLARIEESNTPMPGLMQIVCTGASRFRLLSSSQGRYGLWTGEIEPILADAPMEIPPALQPSANALGALIADLQRSGTPRHLMPMAPPYKLDECAWVADRWSELLPLPMDVKETLLLTPAPEERLARIQATLAEGGLLP
jgi:hypothetical protein